MRRIFQKVSKGLRYKDYRPDAFYPADFEDRTPP